MIDPDILKKFGSTNERLREIFTAKAAPVPAGDNAETPVTGAPRPQADVNRDVANRANIERRLLNRVNEGFLNSLRNYQFYAAADLAWDSCPLNKFTMPLILYAQGKIEVTACADALKGIKGGDDFVKRNDKGVPIRIDLPRFFECNINLVRSFITRRHAAQVNKFCGLYPYYDYAPRSTGLVSKCRADVMSQTAEIWVDQYDVRHHDAQVFRDGFLYCQVLDFITSAWDVQKQWVKKEVAEDLETDEFEVEEEIVKQGLVFENIHPSRTYWDNAYPLSSINTDTGCQFLGYWDVKRWRDVAENTNFFNRDSVGWTAGFWGTASPFWTYKSYFNNFCATISPPGVSALAANDPAGQNDRKNNVGLYGMDMLDTSILVTNHFEKIIPKEIGCGDYPFPVWMRFIVASDFTVVHAEILGSTPAAYLGINASDGRQTNISPAHQLMAYQDQLSNLFSSMLLTVKQELLKVLMVNTDVIDDPAMLAAVRKWFQGDDWGNGNPFVLEYSLKKLVDLELKPDASVFAVAQTRIGQELTQIIQSIAQLIAMAEKLEAMSPAEMGQPAPREISATEVTEIASTTSSLYSFFSRAIDEFRAAKKRMFYESLVALGEGDLSVPVKNRYPEEIIKKAGFEPDPDEKETFVSTQNIHRHTVIGTRRKLISDYVFSSRDGDERAVNTQAANTLVQLLAQIMNVPAILGAMGKSKLFEIVNEIFRMSGAGIDLKLQLKPGEDDSLGGDQVKQFQQVIQQMQQAMQQLAEATQQNAQDAQQQKQINASVDQHFQVLAKIAKEVEKLVASGASESISLNYKDVPEDIKRQMEMKAGFQPSQTPGPIQPMPEG